MTQGGDAGIGYYDGVFVLLCGCGVLGGCVCVMRWPLPTPQRTEGIGDRSTEFPLPEYCPDARPRRGRLVRSLLSGLAVAGETVELPEMGTMEEIQAGFHM
jgi:hypothetical protein